MQEFRLTPVIKYPHWSQCEFCHWLQPEQEQARYQPLQQAVFFS